MDVKQALILLEKYFNNKKSQGELSLNGLDLFEAFKIVQQHLEDRGI